MLRNMIRAAALDSAFYDRAEGDPSLTGQAFLVVVVTGGLAAVGSWIGIGEVVGAGRWETIREWLGLGRLSPSPERGLVFVVVAGIALAVVGWVVWAASTGLVGAKVFGGTTDLGEMLRVLGFAQAPRVIGVIPLLGPVADVWALVASVIAIRQGLDLDTARAIASALGGWLVWWLLQFGVSLLGAGLFQ